MQPLMVFGTGSDAGKTTVVTALCRIFADRGLRVAPFKAQNVSNNSAVSVENGEIARAQCLQAEAARVQPSSLFNPVLLKSQGMSAVQVIVNGHVYQCQSVADYYRDMDWLKERVKAAFAELRQRCDLIVAEGAGSPVELNLLTRDLSNTFIAETFSTRNVLVADIERGGVFASIYGTLALLPPALRQNLAGVIINKFRGDRRFFEDGKQIIEERFGVPVLGILPYRPFNIDLEDSQSLGNYRQRLENALIRVAAIAYPGIANYNDLDALMADPGLDVDILDGPGRLRGYDLILLPGSKTVIRDLRWLKEQGLFAEIRTFQGAVFGICGGYQMLCRELCDPDAIEHDTPSVETGFGFIDDQVVYRRPKILARGSYRLFDGLAVSGYEIHCGRMPRHPLYYRQGSVAGTHVHGIFDNNHFRTAYFQKLNPAYRGYDYQVYRNRCIQDFADMVAGEVDIDALARLRY